MENFIFCAVSISIETLVFAKNKAKRYFLDSLFLSFSSQLKLDLYWTYIHDHMTSETNNWVCVSNGYLWARRIAFFLRFTLYGNWTKYWYYIVVNSPGFTGRGSRNLPRISHGFLKDKPKNTWIFPEFTKDNAENNFMQPYLSISLSFRMK